MMRWSFARWLVVITAAAALWRVGYVVAFTIGDPLRLNDSLYYSMQAGRNAGGEWFRHGLTDQPGAEHGPLTSLYLTPWSLGGGDIVARQRLAVAVLGCLTVPVIGLAARSLMRSAGSRWRERSEVVGVLAAALAACYPPLWINDLVVMSETPAMLAIAAALWAAGTYLERPTLRRAAVVGVLVGLAALARSELALVAVGFAVVIVRTAEPTRRRPQAVAAGVLLLASAATVVPWVAYNLARFEERTLMSTNDGATLLGANCRRSYYDSVGHWDVRCLAPFDTLLDGSIAADASVTSAEQRERAVDYLSDNLDRLPVVVAARVGRLLDVYGLTSMVTNDVGEDKPAWAAWTGVVAWWAAAALAVAGWRQLRAAASPVRWWLLVPLVSVLVTAIVFYGGHRIRAPAEPAIVILAAVAVAHVLGDRRLATRAADVPRHGTDPAHVDVAPADDQVLR